MFKEIFKFYKSKNADPDFSQVLDFDKILKDDDQIRKIDILTSKEKSILGLKPTIEWECYELVNRPGLIFIRNPFTNKGQRYWLARCIRDYPKSPNVVNLLPNNFKSDEIEDWWSSLQNCNNEVYQKKLKTSMRWSTLGYHHDWDTKIYSEKMKNKFPEDLADLSEHFAKVLNFEPYKAEAAIVNYYPIGTTLAGHTDHSESDLEAPLFSFSFGQTAIFLIGGTTKEEKPTALFLKSGDVTVMSKESRLCYHAVPRVMKCDKEPWKDLENEDSEPNNFLIPSVNEPNSKKLKLNINRKDTAANLDQLLWDQCCEKDFWSPFELYLTDSRININVRQVLKEGQKSL